MVSSALPISTPAVREAAALRAHAAGDPPGGDEFSADRLNCRQLRHLTNNVLQTILREISEHAELRRTESDGLIRSDLERRILLTAAIADSLFGLTRETGSMSGRLRSLAEAVIALMGESGQTVDVHVSVVGKCPAPFEETVLRVAHELLGNAVKHGLRGRVLGCISVDLVSNAQGTTLTVTDDGWGCPSLSGQGEGLRLAGLIARDRDGTVHVRFEPGETVARLDIPPAVVPSSDGVGSEQPCR